MMMKIVGTFAEFERAMLRERMRNSLDAARKQGRVGGRRPGLKPHQQKAIVHWSRFIPRRRRLTLGAGRIPSLGAVFVRSVTVSDPLPGECSPMSTPKPAKPTLHRDWRTWIGVVLMLLAALIYVLTLDDALEPGSTPPPPAATVPR